MKGNKRCGKSDQDIERAGGQSSHAPNGRVAGANPNPLNNCNSLREARFGEVFLVDHVHVLERECSLSVHLAGHINVSPVGDDRGRKDLLAWMPSRLVLRTTMMPLRGTRLTKPSRWSIAMASRTGVRLHSEHLRNLTSVDPPQLLRAVDVHFGDGLLQRGRHDGDEHQARKYFSTIGAEFRPGFRASIASRDFQYRRVTGILIERPDEMLEPPRRA